MRLLEPGDRIRVADPWSIARVVTCTPHMMKQFNARGLPTGEKPSIEIVFDYMDGTRRGTRDCVHGDPEWKVVLA